MKNSIIIVGGGITGLTIAYLASLSNYKVTVLEANKEFGGLLNTFDISDTKLEFYYHHFFTHDKEIHWLINELGLNDKLLYKKTSMGVYRNDNIFKFNGIIDLIKFSPISIFGKLRFGLTSLFIGKYADWKKFESISTLEWFYKYAGKKVTDSIWEPLLKIKFGPFSNKVPLSWMIGRLRQRMSSRKNGEERLGYLDGSLNILLINLMDRLKENGVSLVNNSKVDKLIIENNSIKGVVSNRIKYQANKTVLTIPSVYIVDLIKPFNFSLSNKIDNIEYFGAVCVILELNKKLSDIYWLNIADEGFPFGGIIEHTNFISSNNYKGKHIAYLSRYFAKNENISKMSNKEIINLMIPHLKKIYKKFDESSIENIHVFKTNTAAPVCDLNFSLKVVDVKTEISNLFISSMMHVYPDERSVNNSIRIAANTCKIMGINSDFVPDGSSLSALIGFKN